MTHINEFALQLLSWVETIVNFEIKKQIDFMKDYYDGREYGEEVNEKEFRKLILQSIKYNIESDLNHLKNIGE